ncbi:Uncharacterised protein [Klebsiella pneumoniae]|nr:Uncharacterised protein [Klebsiella pneumoniae]
MSVQDEIMDEISDTLLVSDLSKHSMKQFDELSDEFDIQYELLDTGQVLTHSHTYQHELFEKGNLSDGFSYFWFDGQLWRSLAAQQEDSELQVEVFQPISTRIEEVLKALAGYSGLMVLFWLLQWVIVSWRTEQQLAALNLLSKRIAQKTASNLEPIQGHWLLNSVLLQMLHMNYVHLYQPYKCVFRCCNGNISIFQSLIMILSVFKKTFQEVQKYWKIYCYSLAWNLMKQSN